MMEKIASFTIDHDILTPGFYISRIDGDVTTYDLRTRRPNQGDYMSNLTMHSVEHMFATYIRNSALAKDVIYFGPMGCQTGFYLLMRNADHKSVFELTKEILRQIADHSTEMFGASAAECGNYRNLNLRAAQQECRTYLEALKRQEDMSFSYPQK